MNDVQKEWWIYKGDKTIKDLENIKPPSWRQKKRKLTNRVTKDIYIPTQREKELINTALYLRRPLLITGKPGLGKSSLAKSVALDLGLGDILHWHINTKSELKDGLYSYDAIGRLHDKKESKKIGDYLKLGALGSAFASKKKRVLLIDEIDKSDIDFPNDLLYIFEENEFNIPELERLGGTEEIGLYNVSSDDDEQSVMITNGKVVCDDFPIVIMTSNSEREFPPAFMRRCIHLDIKPPQKEELVKIVESHFGEIDEIINEIIDNFLEKRSDTHHLANDQLLNAIYLLLNDESPLESSQEEILDSLWKSLS